MKSLILQTATRYLLPLLVLFSIFLLLQGHNRPGGGFIGGLMAAAALGLCALAFNVAKAREVLPQVPHHLVGSGLLVVAVSGMWGFLHGKPFLTAVWFSVDLPGRFEADVGTPLLFDLGVYLVVIGVVLMILLALAEE